MLVDYKKLFTIDELNLISDKINTIHCELHIIEVILKAMGLVEWSLIIWRPVLPLIISS
jgi:hypothetical protein